MIKSANGVALEAIGDFIKRNPYLLAGGGLGAILGGLGGYNMVDETGDEEADSNARLTGGLAGGLAGLLAGVTAGYVADGSGASQQGAGNVVPEKQDATTGNGGKDAGNEGGLSLAQRAARYLYNITGNESFGQGLLGAGAGSVGGASIAALRNKQLESRYVSAQNTYNDATKAVDAFKNRTGIFDNAKMRKTTYNGVNGAELLDAQNAAKQLETNLAAKVTDDAKMMRSRKGTLVGFAGGIVAEPYAQDLGRRAANALHDWMFPSNQ